MLSAQLLEFSVFQLAQLARKADRRPEVALREIEGLLKQPTSDQAKGLTDLPQELKDDLVEAIHLRNKLVHSFLLEYRIKAAIEDNAEKWALALLAQATEFLDYLNDALDQHAKTKLADAGIVEPFLDEEEMNALRESLSSWADELSWPDER